MTKFEKLVLRALARLLLNWVEEKGGGAREANVQLADELNNAAGRE